MNPTAANPPGPLSVSEPWNLVAEGYAEQAEGVMLPFTRDALDWARPAANAQILDVAAGTGVMTLEAATRTRRVDAIDFSPGMLAQLEKRRSALGLSNVFAQQGDGQNLPFVDASFDAAFSMFGLMFFPDRGRGFRELHRVLRPGCPAVVSSWASVDQSPLMTIMMGALRAADPNRAAPQVNLLSLENPEFFHKEMTDAGFCDVEIRPFTHFMEVEGAEQYWNGMVRSNAPLVLLKQRLSAEEWERQSALSRAFVAEHVRGPCKLATTALLGLGRKPHV